MMLSHAKLSTVNSGAKHHKHKRDTIVFAKSVKLVSGGQLSRMHVCCIGIKII
jgi:hypothetical protein